MEGSEAPLGRGPHLVEEYFRLYYRAIIGLWAISYARLMTGDAGGPLVDAAIHAVLAELRQRRDLAALIDSYQSEGVAHLTLIRSLVLGGPGVELPWLVLDSAYYLRWRELGEPDTL